VTKGERIKHRREQLGISQTELAECIGTSKQNLYKYENDIITNIPSDRVEALAKSLNTSPAYIMGWDESDNLPSPAIAEDTVTFPILTSVAAHYNSVSIDESAAGEHIEVPSSYLKGRKPEDFCAMRVRGDSMYPDFRDGDVVLVLRQSTLNHSGEIGVISYGDDEMTIKRINYVPGEDWIELVPINPSYPPKRIEGVDLECCHIIGIPRVLIREF
jgi:SOS-response transcriptional repressor LexA